MFRLFLLICAASAAPLNKDDEELSRLAMQNPDLFGGDMAGIKSLDDRNGIPFDMFRWPNAEVPYVIDASLKPHMALITAAFNNYHSTTCVRFVPRTNQLDYIRLFAGNGCYSQVGMTGGPQGVSLGSGCIFKGTIVHELGHALGFYHEQNRSDRDDYLQIFMNNVQKGMEHNFDKLKPNQNILYTPFDYDSIMIYGNHAFSKDGTSVTMRAKNG
ncbi:Astacin-like metalloprotease toxin, partial [Stegodyphus mimosarum]